MMKTLNPEHFEDFVPGGLGGYRQAGWGLRPADSRHFLQFLKTPTVRTLFTH